MSDDRERKKRTWKEIDQMRDGGRRGRDDRDFRSDKPGGGRNQQSYRAALDRAFETGRIADLVAVKAPSVAAAVQEASGEAAPSKSKLKLLAKIRDAAGRDDVTAAVDALLKEDDLPDDPDILGRVLEHRDPSLQLQAMKRIDALLDSVKPKRARAMVGQLKMIRDLGDDPEMAELAKKLIDRL